jgi:type IV pilus assembly protein PilW
MNIRYRHHSGLSLVELMVAMAVTLVLVIVVSQAYIGSKNTYRSTDQQAQLYEEGRFALETIGRNIRHAGFVPTNVSTPLIYNFRDAYSAGDVRAIEGCDGGYDLANNSCAAEDSIAPDAIALSYITDEDPDAPGMGQDCAGNGNETTQFITLTNNSTGGSPAYLVTNWYYVDRDATYELNGVVRKLPQLMCRGNGRATPRGEPLFKGVVDMQITYGVHGSPASGILPPQDALAGRDRSYLSVGAVKQAKEIGRALNLSDPDLPDGWDRVTSINVCLTMESLTNSSSATNSQYQDCRGEMVDAPAGFVRRSFTSTYQMKSRKDK